MKKIACFAIALILFTTFANAGEVGDKELAARRVAGGLDHEEAGEARHGQQRPPL